MTEITTLPARVETALNRLQRMNILLLVVGALAIVSFASFALWEAYELRSQATELEQLTDDLCGTLERAGILISGSQENPCER